jgi:hypothetical protein
VTKEGDPAKIGERAYDKTTGRLAQVGMSQQISMLTLLKTPSSVETEGGWEMGSEWDRNKKDHTLPKAVGTSRGLKLQPAFVEWMQGYPLGFTHVESQGSKHSGIVSFPPSPMKSSRESQR